MLTRQDWLLLFIGSPGAQFHADQIRIMKGMFLLSKEGPSEVQDLYAFEPYDYGPFDVGIYHDLDAAQAQGLIQSRTVGGTNRRVFQLTSTGEARAAEFRRQASQAALRAVEEVKKLVTSLSFTDLLSYVYERHPEYAVRSRARL